MYAQQDRTDEQIEHDRIISTDEYKAGFDMGWKVALAWAGVADEHADRPPAGYAGVTLRGSSSKGADA